MEQKEIYLDFLSNVDKLRSGDRVALKRSAGVMLPDADGKAIAAFYRCSYTPLSKWQEEDRYFAVACIKCLWDPTEGEGKPFENILAELIASQELSDSMEHRIEGLLDTAWDADGYLLTKFTRMMKLLRQKSTQKPDFAALLEDLLYWNCDDQRVQRKWARTIFSAR